ncbi:FAR1-related protein [Sesbania bispinosa]|nr:FAR1-related protein [Sesbania bispinosa]
MWATCHMRGTFFADIRTTLRCEALHSQIDKFMNSLYNLLEFFQHFQRCILYIRHREIEADFESEYGEPVLKTALPSLERPVHERDIVMKVVGCKETATCTIYVVTKFCDPLREMASKYGTEIDDNGSGGENEIQHVRDHVCRGTNVMSHGGTQHGNTQRRTRRCSECRTPSHNNRTCPRLVVPLVTLRMNGLKHLLVEHTN